MWLSCVQDGMTSAHIAASNGSRDVLKQLTQFNTTSASAKNKVFFIISSPLAVDTTSNWQQSVLMMFYQLVAGEGVINIFNRQHFFTERVINIWNHLESSVHVVEAKTINTFKSRLQKIHDTDESFFGRYTSHWLRRLSHWLTGVVGQWVDGVAHGSRWWIRWSRSSLDWHRSSSWRRERRTQLSLYVCPSVCLSQSGSSCLALTCAWIAQADLSTESLETEWYNSSRTISHELLSGLHE